MAAAATKTDRPKRYPDVNPRVLSNVQNNVIYACRHLREEAGITQADVARKLSGSLESARNTVSKWERGRWLDNADELIAVYAKLTGQRDAGAIWYRAVRNGAWARPEPGSPKAIVGRAAARLDESGKRARQQTAAALDGRG